MDAYLGWIHEGVQVRIKQGGGTRKITVHKNCDLMTVLVQAKDIFFPNGISRKGNVEQFSFFISDFSDQKLDASRSIQNLLDETKVTHLRLYLSSEKMRPVKRPRTEATSTAVSANSDDDHLPDIPFGNDTLEIAMAELNDSNPSIPDLLDLVNDFPPCQDSSSASGIPDTPVNEVSDTVAAQAPVTPIAIAGNVVPQAPMTPLAFLTLS